MTPAMMTNTNVPQMLTSSYGLIGRTTVTSTVSAVSNDAEKGEQSQDKSDNIKMQVVIAVAIAIGVIIIGFVIVAVVVAKARRRSNRDAPGGDNIHSFSNPVYDEANTETSITVADSPYQDVPVSVSGLSTGKNAGFASGDGYSNFQVAEVGAFGYVDVAPVAPGYVDIQPAAAGTLDHGDSDGDEVDV